MSTTPNTTCPARLLVRGDRIRLGGTVLDVTAVYPLPGRVEMSFLGMDLRVSTDVLDPDLEVAIVRTASQAVTA